MSKTIRRGMVWLRRDLRLDDNTALQHAARLCERLHVVFLFDTELLDGLPRRDRRVEFIRESLVALEREMQALTGRPGCGLIVRHGHASQQISKLAAELGIDAVFANHDYEPAASRRDLAVAQRLAEDGIAFMTFKDQVVFERDDILTQSGKPYTVFTPYKKAWLAKFDAHPVLPDAGAGAATMAAVLAKRPAAQQTAIPSLAALGFEPTNLGQLPIRPGSQGGWQQFQEFLDRIDRYQQARDFPAAKGPSHLGVHLRFGTMSIRRLVAAAHALSMQGNAGATTWLSELIWREFYFQILHHFPHVETGAFKPEYDRIPWETGERADRRFQAWCEGRTGYPLVDAAMAQINQTGYMHNRLRMVVASFLSKDLGLDWRRGERYFARHLNDYDLSANNSGWQWASSSGCDAQPYFRVFNPVTQSRRFDPQGCFIRRYLPALARLDDRQLHAPWELDAAELAAAGVELGRDYPAPIVSHALARQQTLERYAVVRGRTTIQAAAGTLANSRIRASNSSSP